MRAYIGNLSIRMKLMISFLLIATIPTMMIFFNVYNISIENSEQISLNFSQATVEQTSKLMENFLNSCENITTFLAADDEIAAALEETDPEQFPITEWIINAKLLQMHRTTMPDAYGIYVIGENGFQYKSVNKEFCSGELNGEMFYWKALNSRGAYWDGPYEKSRAIDTDETDEGMFLSVGRRIYDSKGLPVGVVIIEIQESVISEMLNSEKSVSEDNKGLSLDFICLVDKTFRIISHTDAEQIGKQLSGSIAYSQDMAAEARYNSDYLTVSRPVGERWMVLGGTYLPDLRQQSTAPFAMIILVLMAVIALVIALSFLLSHYISNPIKRMTELMQEVEDGNLDVRAKMKYYDEMGVMGRVFNNMLEQLQRFMGQIRENEKQLMILQYDVLREQIKPHFMYNTLDSVRWLARDGRNKDVEKLTLSLMKFYRLHLSNGDDAVTLATEAEHVKNYLDIQKIRYQSEIRDYRIEIPEEINRCRMLKLTLQPLVENAIYHGLKNTPDGGSIVISAVYDQQRITICVQDTGVGIPPERLGKLNYMLLNNSTDLGYGLRNVNIRLKLMFGPEAKVWIESIEGTGTQVYVTVPRIDHETEVN